MVLISEGQVRLLHFKIQLFSKKKKKIAGGFVSEKLGIHSVLPTKKSAALEPKLH
jgi:hypothetical protein